MKSYAVKGCLLVVFAAFVVADADAQRSGRKKNDYNLQRIIQQTTAAAK